MKDRIVLSFLVIGDGRNVSLYTDVLEKSGIVQPLNLDHIKSGKNVSQKKSCGQKLFNLLGFLIVPLLSLLLIYLEINLLLVGCLLGITLGYFFFANYYGDEPFAALLRPLAFRESDLNQFDLIPARILRFYGCHNPLVSVFHKVFNRTQGRVVVIAENSLPQSNWGTLHSTLVYRLQGIPSLAVLVCNLKTSEIERDAFEHGFDYVLEHRQLQNLPSIATKQFFMFGRNRVDAKALVPGVFLGIAGALILGVAGGVGKGIGESILKMIYEKMG